MKKTDMRTPINKMPKSMVFISVAIHFVRYQYLIGKKFEDMGVNVSYVTYSKEAANFLKKRKAKFSYIPDAVKRYKLRGNIEKYLGEIEKKYNTNTELILFGDFDHSQMRREKAFRAMVRNFLFWENYLKHNKVDFVLGSAERFVGMIPDIVCKKKGIRYYFWTRSAIENNFVLSQCPKDGHLSILNDYWEKNKNRKLSAKEKAEAQKIIDSITKKKKTLYLVVGTPKIKIKDILFFFKRLFLNIFVERFRNPYARVMGIAWDKTKKAFRKYAVKLMYSKPDLDGKYFFYPLHLDDDAQIILRAPQYADQIPLIKYMARSIPSGYKLYVKEHPNNIGGIPLGRLRKIKKTPNVELISPYFSSHDLARKSAGILTINSTVGWEAMLYRKPVITFGTCFYDISGMVWKMRDLYGLPDTIRRALKENLVDKEKLLRFVNAVAQSDYLGNINFYYQFAKKAMVDENITQMAKGIYKELNK
jgi:capsule polysaccharide modification protein KpsS